MRDVTVGRSSENPSFTAVFREAADAAAAEWGYHPVTDEFVAAFELRIPPGVREEIKRGVALGHVRIAGYRFVLPQLGARKGPYALFSRNRGPGVPSPNWEYFVQLAEFLRLARLARPPLEVGFEDGLMDLSVRLSDELVWCIEVKERAGQAQRLIERLASHAERVDQELADRGNDPLRKAKYLVRHRPAYLSVVAIDFRRDYGVSYLRPSAFQLRELAEPPDIVELATGATVDDPMRPTEAGRSPFGRYDDGGIRLLGIPKLRDGTARHGYGPPVFAQCGYQCAFCGYDMSSPYENWLNLSVDHVVPQHLEKHGWPREWLQDLINLVTCCRACNEFLNGYRVGDLAVPGLLQEFVAIRDRVFDEKLEHAQRRHAIERERYAAAKPAGPTEAQEELDQPAS